MAEFVVLATVFLLMMCAPLLMGILSLDKGSDNKLSIRSDNRRNPRYFAQSFGTMVEGAVREGSGAANIMLSKQEQLMLAETIPPSLRRVDVVVLASECFSVGDGRRFAKEIYARQDITFGKDCIARAVMAAGDLAFSQNCKVVRWADAQGCVSASAGTTLGMSCSSLQRISLEPGCAFRRLYAPEICVTSTVEQVLPQPLGLLPGLLSECSAGKRYTEWLFNVREIKGGSIVRNTIVTRKNLRIGKYATVLGDIRSDRSLHIGCGSVITGNIFSDGYVVLEQGVWVQGVVFTQQSVYCGPQCRVGKDGSIKSLIAKETIALGEGSVINGYVHCERIGRTVSHKEFAKLLPPWIWDDDEMVEEGALDYGAA
jgi:cytoskeletal protein CcmA (bactofilin family)